MSVFSAEMMAIKLVLEQVIFSTIGPCNIDILTDSLSAVQAIKDGNKIGTATNNYLLHEVFLLAQELNTKGINLFPQ